MVSTFLLILKLSYYACFLILAVLLFRLAFRKAPKWLVCVLWCLVGIRLICPFSLESRFSVIPDNLLIPNTNTVGTDTGKVFDAKGTVNYAAGAELNLSDTSGLKDLAVSSENSSIYDSRLTDTQIYDSESQGTIISKVSSFIDNNTIVFAYIWISGMILLALYSAASYTRIRLKVRDAVRYRDNIYQAEQLESAFVMGIVNPRIYVPYNVSDRELELIIEHEKSHIKRLDNIVKPIAYLLLIVHWINPLVWVFYILFSKDIELACDERVIRKLGFESKVIYSKTILDCNIKRSGNIVCPIAFAEIGVKERVKNILNMKKNNKIIVGLALVIIGVIAIGFMTSPKKAVAGEKQSIEDGVVKETDAGLSVVEEETVYATDSNGDNTDEILLAEEADDTIEETDISDINNTELVISVAAGYLTGPFGELHKGVDIASPLGTPIISNVSGTVIEADYDSAKGYYIVVSVSDEITYECHNCDELLFEKESTINAGDTIALLGSTGYSTGPHVHLEVYRNGEAIDPYDYK